MKIATLALLTACAAAADTEPGPRERALSLFEHTDYAGTVSLLGHSEPNAQNLELLGRSYFMMGDFRRASETLERAAALNPGNSKLQMWLGRAYGRRAETSFALSAMSFANKTREALERAVQLDGSNSGAMGDLFDYYLQAPGIVGGGVEKAAALLPEFAKHDPTGALLARASMDEKRHDFTGAEENLRKALVLAPSNPGLVTHLAQFLARRGRFEESDRLFDQAAAQAPNSPRVLLARAATYIKAQRNVETARDLLHRYMSARNLTPNDPPRWEAQQLLKKAEGN